MVALPSEQSSPVRCNYDLYQRVIKMATKEGRYLEQYIGDGAYVYMDPYRGIVFYTSDGIHETNTVVIDIGGISILLDWIARREEFLRSYDTAHEEAQDESAG